MTFSKQDRDDLRYAKTLLENPGLAAKITNALGVPFEKGLELLPRRATELIATVSRKSLQQALRFAVATMDDRPRWDARPTLHKLAVAATGAGGGALGLSALTVELPISTVIMLRSIADIARSEGERVKTTEAKLACLEVFAMGRHPQPDDAVESSYFAVRAALATALSEAAEYLTKNGLTRGSAPALVRFITSVAARFEIAVSEKAAAQLLPVIGAAGGAVINTLFIDHFQSLARGHFIVRRLERTWGPEQVEREYRRV